MNNYKKKYLKYKNKYLQLKNQIAGMPLRNIILKIPDIEDVEMNMYLNPLFGYVFYSNGFIFNYKYFYPETSIGKIINHDKFFIQIGNVIKPSNHLLPKISCTEIGIISGLLYLICIKKINVDENKEIIKRHPIYKPSIKEGSSEPSEESIKRSATLSNNFYKAFYNASTESNLLDLFRLLLVILWWKIDIEDNITEYYQGINSILTSKIKFNLIKQTDDTREFNDLFIKMQNIIELTEMGCPKHFCTNVIYIDTRIDNVELTFPNCGENVLYNLFNILEYFYSKDFIQKLEELNANEKLINFYRIFTQENINKTMDFYGKESNFMDAWSHVISNLNDVNYNRQGIRDGAEYNFEIKGGFSKIQNKLNILQVINELIPTVNLWDDFIASFVKDDLVFNIGEQIISDGTGNINININGSNFTIFLMTSHYEIIQHKINRFSSGSSLDKIKSEFLKNLININFELNPIENFKYIKVSNRYLKYLINNCMHDNDSISDEIYTKIINYSIKYFTDDENEYLYINLNKILDKSIFIKSKILFLVKYTADPSNDFLPTLINLNKLDIPDYIKPLNGSLLTLTKLTKLNLHSFNYPLNGSLSTLTKLTELNLRNFNNPLNDSLLTLENLNKLDLGSFNQPLNDSLLTLIKLTELNLDSFNQPLNGSLLTLIKLTNLRLENYNYPLNYSLSTLINLTKLFLSIYTPSLSNSLSIFTNLECLSINSNELLDDSLLTLTKLTYLNLEHYIQPLNDSLLTLTKLTYLNLELYNHPLDNSLITLTSLTDLRLCSYNHPLENSLITLTSLTDLYLNSYTQPLDNSLITLTSLRDLYLNSYRESLNESLSRLSLLESLSLPRGNVYFNEDNQNLQIDYVIN